MLPWQSQVVATETLWLECLKYLLFAPLQKKEKDFEILVYMKHSHFSNNIFFIKPHACVRYCASGWGFKNGMRPCLQADHPQHILSFILLLINIILNMVPRFKPQMRFNEYRIGVSLLKQNMCRNKYSFWHKFATSLADTSYHFCIFSSYPNFWTAGISN